MNISPDILDINTVRERPLMMSDFRVGRGVQNDPKIGRFGVENGRSVGQKSSDVINGRSLI